MLISHEVPIAMLEESRLFNSFEYCLVHLTEKYPNYKEFYKQSREIYDREVLLDNSIFELGKAFDRDKFHAAILDLKPTMYIVPDVLEDSYNTQLQFEDWMNVGFYNSLRGSFPTIAIGAIQGKTWNGLLDCYKFMVDHADMIAISFDFSYYDVTGEGWTKEARYASGRQRFISQLIEKGVWAWEKPHHLLGTALPQEHHYYFHNNIYNIKSVDSSSPVVHGLSKIKYNSTFGLQSKVKTKLADLIESTPDEEQLDCIYYNIDKFREIVNGQI
jgi:hypothetical protein